MTSQEIVANVIGALESFYNEGGKAGESVFADFAKEHGHLFTAESDATGGENKLEWTDVHKKFCAIFESHIESKSRD